jgi:hypothetical protein
LWPSSISGMHENPSTSSRLRKKKTKARRGYPLKAEIHFNEVHDAKNVVYDLWPCL